MDHSCVSSCTVHRHLSNPLEHTTHARRSQALAASTSQPSDAHSPRPRSPLSLCTRSLALTACAAPPSQRPPAHAMQVALQLSVRIESQDGARGLKAPRLRLKLLEALGLALVDRRPEAAAAAAEAGQDGGCAGRSNRKAVGGAIGRACGPSGVHECYRVLSDASDRGLSSTVSSVRGYSRVS